MSDQAGTARGDIPDRETRERDPSRRESLYRGSRGEDPGLDRGTKRLLAGLGGAGCVLLLGIGGYGLMSGRSNGEVPVIQADARPLREKPANPGGMAVSVEARQNDPSRSKLAPAVEEPNPRALMGGAEPERDVSAPRAKPVIVQLTAAKSEAEAQAAWEKLAKRMPALVGAHRPLFHKVGETGQTPWRLRTGGFSDQGQAKAFCDQVKAKGGRCAVVDS